MLRNPVLLYWFHTLTKSLAFVSFILLANYLGSQLFGVYSYAFALTAFFIPICDLGMDAYLLREVPRLSTDEIPRQFGVVLSCKGVLTFLVFLAMSLATGILDSFGSDRFWMVVLTGLITLLRTYWTTFASFFRAVNSIGHETGMLFLARVGEFLVVIACISMDTGLLMLLATMTIVNILFVSLTHVLVRSRFSQPIMVQDFKQMLAMLRDGFPFALAAICAAIYFNFDTVLLSKIIGDESAGIYRAAYNLVFPLTLLGLAMTGGALPFVSPRHPARNVEVEQIVRQHVSQLLLIALPIAVATTFLASDIVRFLFVPEFAATAQCLAILVWFLPAVFLANYLSNALGAMDEQVFVLKVTMLSAAFNVAANLILVPLYAQNASSTLAVVTAFLGFAVLAGKMRRKISSPISWRTLLRIPACGGAMLPLLLWKPPIHVLFLLSGSVLCYLVALFLFKALTLGDIRMLASSLRAPTKF